MGQFWKNQPVGICQLGENENLITSNPSTTPADPIPLPHDFKWINVSDDQGNVSVDGSYVTVPEIKSFLDANYIADTNQKFRLHYSENFVKDYLLESGYKWNATLVHNGDDSTFIVGFVAAAPKRLKVKNRILNAAEVNLLCVHEYYRNKRFATLLIQEITRKIQSNKVLVAIYTSAQQLPSQPFCTARYYHRLLDIKQLNSVGYTQFPDGEIETAIQHYQHNKKSKVINPLETYLLRPCKKQDIKTVISMASLEDGEFTVHEVIDDQKLERMLNADYVDNYVIEEVNMIKRIKKPVGFISVHHTTMQVLDAREEHRKSVPTSTIHLHWGNVLPCISDLFNILQTRGQWVVNCLDVGKNKLIIRCYNMIPSSYLHYYMYNYKTSIIPVENMYYLVL
jgi:glycylpeptide N-tetradecanoyltransferase